MVHLGKGKMVRPRSGRLFRINRKDCVSRVISISEAWSPGNMVVPKGSINHIFILIQFWFLKILPVLVSELRCYELKVQGVCCRECRFGSCFGGVT
jgi:hypothetical protein